MSIWVVVADASRARIFSAEGRGGELKEFSDHVHSASRLHGKDLETDAPGRSFDSAGQGRHAMGIDAGIRKQQAEAFSRELCGIVEEGHTTQQFEKLYLVAAPGFLGLLRSHLGDGPKNCLVGEINKDLVSHSVAEIRKHLPDFL
jgi:protein required for attachment to host cells